MDVRRWTTAKLGTTLFRPTTLQALVAVVIVIAAGLYADGQSRLAHEQTVRASVLDKVSIIRARLEGQINSNIQLVRGLVSTISTEPDMTQERFASLARHVMADQSHQLRNVAGAPNLEVSLVYPLEGNEAAIGLDYNTNPQQRDATLRARSTGEMVLAGPVELVQGGLAFIARIPVFIEDENGERSFWGLLSAVIDLEALYFETGIDALWQELDLAIWGTDGLGRNGGLFHGNPEVVEDQPVVVDVMLPSGSWTIAARPAGGWSLDPPYQTLLRLLMVAAGALVIIPIIVGGRLIEERQRHIEEQKRRERQLARLSRRLELALSTSQVGVWEYNIVTGQLHWDDRMNELYGSPQDSGPRDYTHWRNALHPDDLDRARSEFHHAIQTHERYQSTYRIVTSDQPERHIRAIGAVYKDDNGVPRIVGVNWDVSADIALNADLRRAKTMAEAKNIELEAAKARIEHNSLHDSLTGLPNRRYLDEVLERHAARCKRAGGSAALLHIDLDRFKQINDTLGHAAGDAMLMHASRVLKAHSRGGDFVARIGGDEFVIFCTHGTDRASLAALAMRIIAEMRRPVSYEGHECRFGVSVGIANAKGREVEPERLLVNADIALYRAKRRGRNRHEFFTQALQAEIVGGKQMADDILKGIETDAFIPYYQPQFDAHTLDVVGVEALVRWVHPERGIVAPDSFLSTAEELNVVATIDRLILEKSLVNHARWAERGHPLPRVSVNVSSRRLHDEDLITTLKQLRIPPGLIAFELVESIYLDDNDETVSFNIDQIKDLGIDIEIDDFGTGYASIVSVTKLRPARLKIDRQIVNPIVSSKTQRDLVKSIVDIGRSLGISVVAEGVESMEHARMLRELGCDILQGYAFARPMSADDLVGFLDAQAWRKAS